MSILKSCYWNTITVNGWTVQGEAGNRFRAINGDTIISFEAEGRNGGLYFNIRRVSYAGRYYTSPRFTAKYTATVRELAFHLANNDYLWDYVLQCPYNDAAAGRRKEVNAERVARGLQPLY